MHPGLQDRAGDQDIMLKQIWRKGSSPVLNLEEVNSIAAENTPSEASSTSDWGNPQSDGASKSKRRKGKKKSRKENVEAPKIPLSRNRARAFGHFLLFHAIPLGGAMALIILNIKARFYGSDGRWIAALQFVAKAHEMLMQFSIVTVMTAFLQYLLIHRKSVPFGALFSAYQVTQMSYLWSPEFRAAVTASGFAGSLKFLFILFVPFSVLLAAAVGPSSAIAMQPRRVNFTVPSTRLALNVPREVLFPDALDMAGPPLVFNNSFENELSPAAGWQNLANLPAVGDFSNTSDIESTQTGLQQQSVRIDASSGTVIEVMPKIYSTQLQTYGQDIVIRTLYVQYAPNSTFATTQSVPVALALANAASTFVTDLGDRPGIDIASIEMAQPFASVFCQLNSIMDDNDSRPIQFPNTYIAGCGSEEDCANSHVLNKAGVTTYTAITRRQIWDQAKINPQGRIIWVDGTDVSSSVPGAALGAIVVQPEFCKTTSTFLTTSACMIGGRWANTTSFLQGSSDGLNAMTAGVVENFVSPQSPSTLPQWSLPSVKLSKAWAESLSPLTDIQNRTVADNLLRLLPVTTNVCPPDGSYPDKLPQIQHHDSRPFMHERLLASLVANGMSHAAGATELWQWDPTESDPNRRWTFFSSITNQDKNQATPPGFVLTLNGQLSGYAWSLDGVPIKLALPILFLYCIFVLAYVLYTFITGRSSTTWRSISDLVALAMNSTPSKVLRHTSSGIAQTDTFRKLISVREVEEHERLELVFKEDDERNGPYRVVAVGRGYS